MDFKINIYCCECECAFQITTTHIKDMNELKCPNCQQEMPKEILEALKNGFGYLLPIETVISDDLPFGNDHFKLSVEEIKE